MCFDQNGATLHWMTNLWNYGDQFLYFGSNISSIKSDINKCICKSWTAIYILTTIKESDLSYKRELEFFQAATVIELLYGRITCTQTKRLEKVRSELHHLLISVLSFLISFFFPLLAFADSLSFCFFYVDVSFVFIIWVS